jgi:peptide deformylase
LPGSGEEVLVETDAFEARALQHELDHLDGFVFLDRVVGPHAVFARKTYL